MNRYPILCGLTVLLLLNPLSASAQTSAGFNLWRAHSSLNDSSLFALPADWQSIPGDQLNADLWLRWQYHGTVFEGSLLSQQSEPGDHRQRGRINEIYRDFSVYGLEFTVGKKIISSGIGYSFRPLDLIQGEDRRNLQDSRLEGVPLLRVESIDADSALSATWYNRLRMNDSGIDTADDQLLLHYYRLWHDTESEFLCHYHETEGVAVGAGFTQVSGDTLEWHGALLLRHRVQRSSHSLLDSGQLLANQDPWQTSDVSNQGDILLGLNWSDGSGLGVVAEIWHDASAMSRDEWKKLFALAKDQRSLQGLVPDSALYGNLAWDSQAYQASALLPDNLLLRLSWDGDRVDSWIDLLVTPEDGGSVTTLGISWALRQGLKLDVGYRVFSGDDDSVYGQLPISSTAYLQLHGDMLW